MTLARKSGKGDKTLPVIDKDGLTSSNFDHVIAFAKKIQEIRNSWDTDLEKEPQGLLLFSGDLFSASVESLLTRGRNMVHLMNELAPDACVPGNHEFDFGRQRFNELVEFCNFPWLLSNVEEYPLDEQKAPDRTKSTKELDGLSKYMVLERKGVRIGIIGLVSDDTISKTNTESKAPFAVTPMADSCIQLAAALRKPKSESGQGCDLVFALTHALHEEDIQLANRTNAFAAESEVLNKREEKLEDLPGIDVIFGGHDHHYYLGQGVKMVGEADPNSEEAAVYRPRLDKDDGLLIVKSGTDFEDLSQVEITIEDRPNGKARKKIITSLIVTRHRMQSIYSTAQDKSSPMARVLKRQYNNEVLAGLNLPVATTKQAIDVDGDKGRSGETVIGNWIADVMLKWHDHLWDEGKESRPKAFIMSAGSIRGVLRLGPGVISAGEMIQLQAFETPLAALDLKGFDLKAGLAAAFAKMDAQKTGTLSSGAFPVVSGLRIKWDSKAPKDSRLKEVCFIDGDGKTSDIDPNETYHILTSSYLADGNDGYSAFTNGTNRTKYANLPMYQVLLYHMNDLAALKAHHSNWELLHDIFDISKHGLESLFGNKPWLADAFHFIAGLGKAVEEDEKESILRSKLKQDEKKKLVKKVDLDGLPELDIDTDLTHLGKRVIDVGSVA